MNRAKLPKKEKVKIARVNMEKHKLSYLFKNYSEELKEKIDHIEIEHIPGAIVSSVYFKQEHNPDEPDNPKNPKSIPNRKSYSEESVKKDESAYSSQ